MLFFKWEFLVFMSVVLPVYFALRRTRFWLLWLLAASYFFYAWWKPYYLLLVIYSTALDYLLVMLMDHSPPLDTSPKGFPLWDELHSDNSSDGSASPKIMESGSQKSGAEDTLRRPPRDRVLNTALAVSSILAALLVAGAIFGSPAFRPTFLVFSVLVLLMALGSALASRQIWLIISIVNNLTLLLFFKYARFIEENLNQVLANFGSGLRFSDPSSLLPPGWEYILPVGVSFFTFQSMSYTIDFYLGKAQRERNFLRFATFVCFFPQLMAGPIERARQMLPQFRQPPPVDGQMFADGCSLFLVGLFKKVAIANYLSVYVDRVYDNPAAFDATSLIVATVAFAWQIYADFSGYTDMARGVAKMMGFHLIINFNHPYLSSGLGEFWQRWHISLSSWFRDYLYIPLGGNRHGTLATYRNLLIVFVVSGIWHGAAWTFVIWGFLHAVGIMLTRELERSAFYRERVPKMLKQAWVFAFVCFAWIFFRAASPGDARIILDKIFSSAWRTPQVPALMIGLVGLVWIYQAMCESRVRSWLAIPQVRVVLATCMLIYLSLCSAGGGAFIYFQF